MLTIIWAIALLGVVAADPGVQVGQDFSGDWTLISDKSEPFGTSAFGENFKATQKQGSLNISRVVQRHASRGPNQQKNNAAVVELTFLFDGTETNVSDIFTSPRTGVHVYDTSSWAAGRLIVRKMSRSVAGTREVSRQELWLETDGTLVVESTRRDVEPVGAFRSYYRRIRAEGSQNNGLMTLRAGPKISMCYRPEGATSRRLMAGIGA